MGQVSHDSETPAHGQQVITACAFIHHNFDGVEKIFLPKRAATKKFYPNIYELPGGHIDFGEDTVEGLKRELKEETSMNIRVGDPFAAFDYANEVKGSHSIEVIYFAKFVEPIEQIQLDPEDHSGFIWFSEKDDINLLKQGRKSEDDGEIKAIYKGFAILRGERLLT